MESIDALVAQHVFGWQLQGDQWINPKTGKTVPLPAFSEDIAAAWWIVDQIFDQERGFRLQLEGAKLWQARFYKSVSHTLETRAMAAQANHPARAICLAALAVRGISTPSGA